MGPGWRGKCPEKRTVPVGSGDVCSTVHGSYQLSTGPHPPRPAPAARMHAGQVEPAGIPARGALGPGWFLYLPIKPKEKKIVFKIHTPKSYTRFWAK